jgi:hypothetical protein
MLPQKPFPILILLLCNLTKAREKRKKGMERKRNGRKRWGGTQLQLAVSFKAN